MDTNGLFGRLVKVDRRDKRFPITAVLPRGAKRRSYTWACSVQLNQGHVGACTGFSVAAEAAARPAIVGGITNKVALEVYYRAQELDDIPGEDYEGSTVRGAMKAATERGWYREYRWAANEEELAMAIGYHGPAVLGIDWYEGMMTPDSSGLVAVTGDVQGGHAILCVGYNAKRGLYRLHNSWGRQWGKDGDCFVTQADMKRLLRGFGEACIPVKRLVPRMGK